MMLLAGGYRKTSWGMPTERDVVVDIDGDILSDFNLVNTFEDCQPMAHAVDSHFFQFFVP